MAACPMGNSAQNAATPRFTGGASEKAGARQARLPMIAAAPVTATNASTAAAKKPRSAVGGVDDVSLAALLESPAAEVPNA